MIRRSKLEAFDTAPELKSDILIHALGFERRSSAVLKSKISSNTGQIISLLFKNEARLSFHDNLAVANKRQAKLVDDYTKFFRTDFPETIMAMNHRLGRRARLTIDISSMNRTMIATTLFEVLTLRQNLDAVSLIYVPGEFHEPKSEFPAIEQIGAVIPELSGFSADPELPIGVVAGLGYEYGLAVGLINRLEPRLTVCFRAVGHDPRYEEACRIANLDFDFGGNPIELGSYPILDAAAAFNYLENVVYGMSKSFRVVIVPLGPKLFAALATLIAIKNFSAVSVWRVAAQLEIFDVIPCNEFLRLELDLDCPMPPLGMT
jgi:hypothetical protein